VIFQTRIKELSDLYLLDARAPDITGFVEQLFSVAAETGSLACVLDGDRSLRFFVHSPQGHTTAPAPASSSMQAACFVEHGTARTILRMICARLGVLCKERAATDVSPYGDKAVLDYGVGDHRRWIVSFCNTPPRQEFSIEAV
jgi:hypothetical protein